MGLEIQEVSVRFGGLAALSEVSLSAAEGAITGLIGPNGAGKTTLFNVVTGMQRPNAGTVRLDSRDLRGLSSYRRARLGLGRTFQRLELFGTLTVAENIGVAASIAQRGVVKARSRAIQEIREEILDRLGLTAVANDRADTLPTGTGRLVELARALATRPKVLLLDEPAAGQDTDETERFSEVLRYLANDGLAILLVEHDMELVMNVCHTRRGPRLWPRHLHRHAGGGPGRPRGPGRVSRHSVDGGAPMPEPLVGVPGRPGGLRGSRGDPRDRRDVRRGCRDRCPRGQRCRKVDPPRPGGRHHGAERGRGPLRR